jgi:hypothetical protein
VETHCQVFHLCRTVSGVLTLESTFVCPLGTVFNQAERHCDTWKEVVCALYSVPEYPFKKSTATATRNQGYKDENKYQISKKGSQNKLRMFKPAKKETVYKLGTHENYKMKRETTKEAFGYYDYVDDNYEAHVAKPVNRDMSSQNDQIKQSESIISVEDYDYNYDTADVSSEEDKRQEPYLSKYQTNEEDDQEYIDLEGKVNTDTDRSNKTSSELYESYVNYTTENTLLAIGLYHNESKATIPIPDQLAGQNKSDRSEVKVKDDYVHEYEYNDAHMMTFAPRYIKQTNHTLQKNADFKNDPELKTLEPNQDVTISCQSVTNVDVKNCVNFTNTVHSLTDTVTFATNVTEITLNMNNNDTLKTEQNLEIKIVPKLDSAHSSITSNDYEYYYDEEYSDSNETETNSDSEHLPIAKTETQVFFPANKCSNTTNSDSEKQDYCAHYVVTEGTKQQIHRPAVEVEENVNDKHESGNFNLTMKTSEKSNAKHRISSQLTANTQMNYRTGITDHSAQKSSFTQRNIISELLELSTNSVPLQETDRRTTTSTSAGQTDKKFFENNNHDHITLAFLTSELHKKIPATSQIETINSALVSNEKAAASHRLNSSIQNEHILDSKEISSEETTLHLGLADYTTVIATIAKPQKENISPFYSTTSSVGVMPLLQVEESLPQSSEGTEEQTTVSEAEQTPFRSDALSLFEPAKPRNVFKNHFSTSLPPPVVIQSRETLTSSEPTIGRNHYRGTTDYTGNIITEDEAKSRKLHRITLLPNENPNTDVSGQELAKSYTTASTTAITTTATIAAITAATATATATTVVPYIVADDPVTADQEETLQNTFSRIQTSEIVTTEETSTVPYRQFSAHDVRYKLRAEIPVSFSRGSKMSANTTDKSLYANKEAFYSSTASAESTLSSKLHTFSPLNNSLHISTSQYDKHNFTIVNPTIIYNDDKVLNQSTPDDSSDDDEIKKNFKLTRQNFTTALVLPINGLSVPITVTLSAFGTHPNENTKVLPDTSPSSHLGYTLSSVSVSSVPGFVCTGKQLHQYHPDPEDCRMFHYCSPGFHRQQVLDFRFICENGTAFKADTQKCENESLTPICTNFEDKK